MNARVALPFAVFLAGCSGHLPWTTIPATAPDRVPVIVPAKFSAPVETGKAPDRWWAELGDPGLVEVVERALSDNLGLRQAWARLEQANAVLARTAAGRLPEVTGEGQASR